MIEYYIVYWYKGKTKQGLGSVFCKTTEPINKENYNMLVDELKAHAKKKS